MLKIWIEIFDWDVEKFGNGNLVDGGNWGFKKKYKENLLRKRKKI